MDAISALIETLEVKETLTDLESDILETFKECTRNPFKRKSAETRMILNYAKYEDIFNKVALVPGAVPRPSSDLPDEDILGNLQYQLALLTEKEQREQYNGK